jgi:hypothetical protein
MLDTSLAIPDELVEQTILLVRGKKVILDRELARLYGVSTKVLNQAVKRNVNRFPEDFMFQLTMDEANAVLAPQPSARLRSQIVTLKRPRGKHLKYRPFAFTEHGILMLSSVLKSERAIHVNIQIMRTFVRLREMLTSNAEFVRRLDDLELTYDENFRIVFKALGQLMAPPAAKRKQIGFSTKALKT